MHYSTSSNNFDFKKPVKSRGKSTANETYVCPYFFWNKVLKKNWILRYLKIGIFQRLIGVILHYLFYASEIDK